MKTGRGLWILTLVAVAVLMSQLPQPSPRTQRSSPVSRFLRVGPQAIPSSVTKSNYRLFACQVGLDPTAVCYDPYQMRHAYNIDSLIQAGYDGTGKTIVIVDAFQSPNIVLQLNTYNTFYGLPSLNGLGAPANPSLGSFTQIAPDGLTPFDPMNDDMIGWASEISLDVTWAHAIAPGANIVLVLAKSDDDADILSATKYAVDHNLGDVISQSFGENEGCADPNLLAQQHEVFAQATMKKITLFASSGDFGSGLPTCDGANLVKAASSPAVDPLVSAVGGTELHADGYCLPALGCDPSANPPFGTREGEIVWNESDFGASGGGFSGLFDEPSYQNGTIPGGKQRGEPDISYNAAVLHGVLTYLNIPGVGSGFFLFGGTSAGSPQWAAIIAIADQKAGYNLGFINSALYRIGQVPTKYSATLFDITLGNNSFLGVDGFKAGKGWDAASGLGSPNAGQLAAQLIQLVSPGDGAAAIAGSMPHTQGNKPGLGRARPY